MSVRQNQGTGSTTPGTNTEYTEGDIDASLTGIVSMAEGPSNTATPLQVDASKHLQVDIAADSVGIGGGTQYTEDSAAAADPVGTVPILVRKDTPATTVSTDGDNIAQRGTNYGAAYVTLLDTSGNPVSVGGGTQYADGAADPAPATGTVALGTDGTNLQALSTTSTGALNVAQATAANLNCTEASASAIKTAVETIDNFISGSRGLVTEDNSAAIKTAVEVIDNFISGSRGLVTEDSAAAIKTAVELIDNAVSGAGFNVTQLGGVNVSMNTGVRDTGTQRVTIATNDVVPVSDNSGSLTVDQPTAANLNCTEASASAIKTAVELIDNAVSGSGFNITQLGGVNVSMNTGVRDTGTQRVTIATNDVVPVSDNSGSLTVDQPTAANLNCTEASASAIKTAVELIDDVIYTDDTSTHATGTSKGALFMAAATPTDGSVNANDIGAVAMTTDRKLHVSVQDSLPAGTNGIGKLTSNSGVNIGAVEIVAAQTLATVTTVSTLTNQSQEGGVNISLNAGAVDTGTRRVVQANGAGKTILSAGGSASSSGNNTLVAAGTNRLKVKAFSLTTTSTTAMTCIFQSGSGGTELWRVVIQAPSGASAGANLSTAAPDWLFATASATLLNLNLSSANAVHWSVSYYDEA